MRLILEASSREISNSALASIEGIEQDLKEFKELLTQNQDHLTKKDIVSKLVTLRSELNNITTTIRRQYFPSTDTLSDEKYIDLIALAYSNEYNTDAIEKILLDNGSDPDADEWTTSIKDFKKVYNDIRDYLIKQYCPLDEKGYEVPTVLIDAFNLY